MKRIASQKTLQRTAEEIAAFLRGHNLCALPYHAGLADDVRSHAQEAFMCGECEVIVATIAFGMGIDKAGIRCVVHFNLPKTLENYQQETGRAGRDGHASLRAPRALARFLCGITSPAITRDRLTRHDAFGLLSDMAFHDVLDFALREV
jgi:superfamily II DNA/RNA helicase